MIAADRHPVNVLWLTSGLGCDGDSVAMTAARSPSFEDLIRGCFPGAPPLVIYNPLFAYETGDEFMRAWFDGRRREARAVHPRARGLGSERGDQRRRVLGDDRCGPRYRRADLDLYVDRPARAPRRRSARARHMRGVRRDPRDAGQPHGRHGAPRLPRRSWTRASSPIINVPGCPAQPDNITETLLHMAMFVAGAGPMLDIDDARPTTLAVRQDRPAGVRPRRLRRTGGVRADARRPPRVPGEARLQGAGGDVQRPAARMGGRGRRVPECRRDL